jgi:hypothetical protein
MRVDFTNYKAVNIGDVVFDLKSEQAGIILAMDFGYRYGFMVQIMFESGFTASLKGCGDRCDQIELTGCDIDLSRMTGLSDPYKKVISLLKEERKRYQKHKIDTHAIG